MVQKFKNLLTVFVLMILFTNCATTKDRFVKSEIIKNDSIYIKRDSVILTSISLGIKDTAFFPIRTGNLQLDSLLINQLANFQIGKKSGLNEYKISFDTKAKGFQITSTIKQTKNEIRRKHDSIYQNKAIETQKEHKELKTKTKLPTWLIIVFIILLMVVYILTKIRII